ncbi:hypothetical protein V1J52_06345 [Streptomyces sp. TRM 70351]|uniref:hypothetical protein n=1 Tax=Streptomyces sp. TRM 70351 TaxID=3116552 RepID=UPI002E7BB5A4|nr:hypothetical protein [Streptomyces sp. TRM 70351]MEE1927814.1 hypothetical protein [Streptomyces sp. TRM 70351]
MPDESLLIQVFPLEEASPAESMELARAEAGRRPGYRETDTALAPPLRGGSVVHEYAYETEDSGSRLVYDERFTAADGTRYCVLTHGPLDDPALVARHHRDAVRSFTVN